MVGPNDFNQQVVTITKKVMLRAQNELIVELNGKPTSAIEISVTQSNTAMPGMSGYVIRADGTSVPGADVKVILASGKTYRATSNSLGNFALSLPTISNSFIIEANSADGQLRGSVSGGLLDTAPQAFVTLVVAEQGPGSVTGTVVSMNGAIVPRAIVTLAFMESAYTASVAADAHGNFGFAGLPADGTFVVIAHDPATAASGNLMSFLTSNYLTQNLVVEVQVPNSVNQGFTNGSFSSGTFKGWETEGDVRIVPKEELFPGLNSVPSNQISTLSTLPNCNPEPFAALVTTAGDDRTQGSLSQTFVVGAGQDTLVGTIRFLSDEWPYWYGSQFNDSYVVYLDTPSGTKILARGNLNGSNWGQGVSGFSGATPEINVSVDVSAYAPSAYGSGKTVTLRVVVEDVGDTIVDSAVAVAGFRILDLDQRNVVAVGVWTGPTMESFETGQLVWITVTNSNVVPVGIGITEYGRIVGGTYDKESKPPVLIAPTMSHTFAFRGVLAYPPISRSFRIDVPDAFGFGDSAYLIYKIESEWAPGMTPHPCYNN